MPPAHPADSARGPFLRRLSMAWPQCFTWFDGEVLKGLKYGLLLGALALASMLLLMRPSPHFGATRSSAAARGNDIIARQTTVTPPVVPVIAAITRQLDFAGQEA